MDIYANNRIGKSTNSTCYGKGHQQNLGKTLEFEFHILNTRIVSKLFLIETLFWILLLRNRLLEKDIFPNLS